MIHIDLLSFLENNMIKCMCKCKYQDTCLGAVLLLRMIKYKGKGSRSFTIYAELTFNFWWKMGILAVASYVICSTLKCKCKFD